MSSLQWKRNENVKFEVKNRFTGKVQFIAEIECDESASRSVKLGLAVKWAVRTDANLGGADLWNADLRGANLGGADIRDADLWNADLRNANLRGANLGGADIRDADLWNADLRNANLRGANLGGADLWNADLISLGSRSDGYDFYAQIKDGETWIKAGCRYFSATDARKHWSDTRGGTALGDESQAMIDHAERMVAIRGLMEKSK